MAVGERLMIVCQDGNNFWRIILMTRFVLMVQGIQATSIDLFSFYGCRLFQENLILFVLQTQHSTVIQQYSVFFFWNGTGRRAARCINKERVKPRGYKSSRPRANLTFCHVEAPGHSLQLSGWASRAGSGGSETCRGNWGRALREKFQELRHRSNGSLTNCIFGIPWHL